MRNIFKCLSIIIIVCVVVMLFINNKSIIIEKMPFRILTIKSNSMYPILKVNDIIIIKKSNNYNVNDIITYNVNNEYLITHRIIKKTDNGYITKGDNNNIEDDKIIKNENIEGKTICIINKKHQIIIFFLFISLLLFVFFK